MFFETSDGLLFIYIFKNLRGSWLLFNFYSYVLPPPSLRDTPLKEGDEQNLTPLFLSVGEESSLHTHPMS